MFLLMWKIKLVDQLLSAY